MPTISIFGSTEPLRTGPPGRGHRIFRHHVECSPCFLRECPLDFRCMHAVTSAEVVGRSEEHTSELQSQSNLVCRLLLATKTRASRREFLSPSSRPTCWRKAACRSCRPNPHGRVLRTTQTIALPRPYH